MDYKITIWGVLITYQVWPVGAPSHRLLASPSFVDFLMLWSSKLLQAHPDLSQPQPGMNHFSKEPSRELSHVLFFPTTFSRGMGSWFEFKEDPDIS